MIDAGVGGTETWNDGISADEWSPLGVRARTGRWRGSAGHTGATTEPGGDPDLRRHAGVRRLQRSAHPRPGARLGRRVAARQLADLRDARDDGTGVDRGRARCSPASGRRATTALDWTFELQTGVTFHDGEPFNAAAVCFNFDRWYNFTGPLQLNSGAYYWRVIFGGFAANEPDSDAPETSLYESCEAVDDDTVDPPPHRTVGGVPQRPRAAAVLDRQPQGADRVRRRHRHPRPRRQPGAAGHVRHRAPDRHRTVEVRRVDPQRPPDAHPLRRLLGRAVAARRGHLPADPRQRRPPAGIADRRDRRLRPRRPAGPGDDRLRLGAAADRAAVVQRRLRRLQPDVRRRSTTSTSGGRSPTPSIARP